MIDNLFCAALALALFVGGGYAIGTATRDLTQPSQHMAHTKSGPATQARVSVATLR